MVQHPVAQLFEHRAKLQTGEGGCEARNNNIGVDIVFDKTNIIIEVNLNNIFMMYNDIFNGGAITEQIKQLAHCFYKSSLF